MTRFDIVRTFTTEYLLVGATAGLIGASGAVAISWYMLTREMDIDWMWRPGLIVGAVLLSLVMSVLVGLLASARSLSRPPIDALRER